jgi:hypothetical protein
MFAQPYRLTLNDQVVPRFFGQIQSPMKRLLKVLFIQSAFGAPLPIPHCLPGFPVIFGEPAANSPQRISYFLRDILFHLKLIEMTHRTRLLYKNTYPGSSLRPCSLLAIQTIKPRQYFR